jgi:hypothetical protein
MSKAKDNVIPFPEKQQLQAEPVNLLNQLKGSFTNTLRDKLRNECRELHGFTKPN